MGIGVEMSTMVVIADKSDANYCRNVFDSGDQGQSSLEMSMRMVFEDTMEWK